MALIIVLFLLKPTSDSGFEITTSSPYLPGQTSMTSPGADAVIAALIVVKQPCEPLRFTQCVAANAVGAMRIVRANARSEMEMLSLRCDFNLGSPLMNELASVGTSASIDRPCSVTIRKGTASAVPQQAQTMRALAPEG